MQTLSQNDITLFCDNICHKTEIGNLVGAVYIDLTKAFDTIGHAPGLDKYKICVH